jgi:hypothetical protein
MKKLNVFACSFLFLITSVMSGKLDALQNFMQQADQLIEQSYANMQSAKTVKLFMRQHSYYQLEQMHTMPTVAEILFTISQLQDPYDFIVDQNLREQALDVLRATIIATKNAIEKIEIQMVQNHTLSSDNLTILQSIQYQNKLLRTKFSQVKHRSMQSYLAQPSTWYLIAGAACMVSLGSIAYYYNFGADNQESSFVLTPQETEQIEHNPAHQQARDILAEIATSKEKLDLNSYLPAAKNLTQNLDPRLDQDLKKLIDTFIEIQEGGFWAKAKAKTHEKALKQTYAKTLNSNPTIRIQAPNGIMWQIEDINVARLVQ